MTSSLFLEADRPSVWPAEPLGAEVSAAQNGEVTGWRTHQTITHSEFSSYQSHTVRWRKLNQSDTAAPEQQPSNHSACGGLCARTRVCVLIMSLLPDRSGVACQNMRQRFRPHCSQNTNTHQERPTTNRRYAEGHCPIFSASLRLETASVDRQRRCSLTTIKTCR